MSKICSKCGKEVSLLVKGQVCKKCREIILSEGLRKTIVEIPDDVSNVEDRILLDVLAHNFKVHCSTGFRTQLEQENFDRTCKVYKARFGKELPKIGGKRR